MIELGKKTNVAGADDMRRICDISGRPTKMPSLPSKDHRVICGYDQGLGERLFVCESLEDMQELYDAYYGGLALRIHWYSGADPGFILVLTPGKKS